MQISPEAITEAAQEYFVQFDNFIRKHNLPKHAPATLAWKVTDISEFTQTLSGFLQSSTVTQCHIGYVDKRYIASIVCKDPLYRGAHILKLMQRRPGSTDPVGFDHADFVVKSSAVMATELNKYPDIRWTHESNQMHSWISVWFDGTEAKFVDHLVLDVGIKEMQDAAEQLGLTPKKLI